MIYSYVTHRWRKHGYKSMIQEKEEVTARDLLFTSGEAAVKIQEAKNNTKRAAGSITSGASGLSRKASGGTLSLPRVNGGSGVKLEDLEERWEAKDSVVGKGDREDDDAGSVESVITATTTASFLELERMDSTRMEEEVLKVWADQQTFSSSADEEVEEIPPVVVLTSVVTPPVVVSIPRSFKTVSFSAVDDVVEFPVDQESSSLNVVEESCEIVEVAPVESLTTGMYEAQPLKPESVTYPDVVGQMYHVKPFYGKTEEFTATDVDSSFGASANANLQLNERTDVEEHGSTTPESGEDSSLIVATLESDASLLLSKSSEVVQVGVLNSNVNESQSTESTLVRKPSKIVALETETPPDSSAESTDLEVEVEVGAAEAKSKKKKSKKSAKKRK
ncbi:hypothetical protein BDR26DRAFT_717182 [Obelidium mucronatum]|nr:hypothetical protein BDR26DRAFT_717182 [Obelidium mucronatum]